MSKRDRPPQTTFRSLRAAIATLYSFMPASQRRQLVRLTILMPAAAMAEMVTVASIIPLLALLAGEPQLEKIPWLADALTAISSRFDASLLVVAGGLFIAAALIAAVIRLQLARSSQRFAYGLGHELAVEIQRRVLLQPYLFHVGHHSSRIISSLEKVEQFIFSLMLPTVHAVGAAFIALFITAALFAVDAQSTTLALVSVTGAYALVLLATRRRLGEYSATIGTAYDQRIQAVQESLGGIRDIIIDHSQPLYLEAFRSIDERLTRARTEIAILGIAPRYVIEAVGMVVFALLALGLASEPGGLSAALPVLGALALGAQRLLPLVQQLYRGWASLAGSRSIIRQLLALLRLPVEAAPTAPPLAFSQEIRLENVGFSYAERAVPALDQVSLVIRKGARVALVGRTGSGKTTLTDLIMGLIQPSMGRILIDGVELNRGTASAWQRNIAHVPQAIFLADDSIARNIAFAHPDRALDMERVQWATGLAQLGAFVDDLPDRYDTMVGERGVRLSGGQRQRLGLARAIYKRTPLLLLDEATSALDDATEEAVLSALDALGEAGTTILIVAHRASTIATCDEIVRIDDGRIVDIQERPADPKRL